MFAIGALGFYYERKEKAIKEHHDWIYECEQRLRSISNQFERACFDATEEVFEKYCWNIRNCVYYCTLEQRNSLLLSEHKRTIDYLQKDYIENLAEKYSKGYAYRGIDRLPAYLIEEYNERIKDIVYRYNDINFTMKMRIRTMSPEYIKASESEST